MDKEITEWMEKNHVPGVAACIVRGHDVVRSYGYGLANIEKKIPFTPDRSIFQIASISKTVTATAVMKLYEAGALALDDDVNKYLRFSVRNPKFPDVPITFRHLLTHTSSIKDNDAIYTLYAAGDPQMSLEDVVMQHFVRDGAFWSQKNFRKKPPEHSECYSNLGFALLGYLIENIAGVALEDYLQEHMFTPLKINETSFYICKLDRERQARPYTYAEKSKRKLCQGDGDGNLLPDGVQPTAGFNEHALYSYPTLADGMIRTSVDQLANFMIAIMNGGRFQEARILEQATVNEMLPTQGRGLGWFKKKKYWGHDGSDPGCATEMWFNRKAKVGFIVFANADVELKKVLRLLKIEAQEQTRTDTSC